MISAQVGDTIILYAEGEVGVFPPDPALERKFTRPAQGIEGGVSFDDDSLPVNERRLVKLPPGTGAHFRAVLLSIRGARVVVDGGDA